MKIRVVNKTNCILSLNKIGVSIRGQEEVVLNIDSKDKENEVMGLVNAKFLDLLDEIAGVKNKDIEIDKTGTTEKTETPDKKAKKKTGRPKGSKNKKNLTEQQRVKIAEDETQKMGSRAIISTGNGVKESKMSRSVIDDMPDSERTRASIEAMEKLEKEEKEEINLGDTEIDESKLDASEQKGRKATIVTEGGEKGVKMANSILPDSEQAKKVDPFIDKPPKVTNDQEDDYSDSFIKDL